MEENENMVEDEYTEESQEETSYQEEASYPAIPVKTPKKSLAVVTYVIALVCMLAGLVVPLYAGVEALGDKMLIKYLPGMVNGVFSFTGERVEMISVDLLPWFLTTYPQNCLSSINGLLYIITCLVALIMLIPVCVCKRDSGKSFKCATVTEGIAMAVTALFMLSTLNDWGTGYFPLAMFIAFGGLALMMIIQSIANTGYLGIFKTVAFVLAIIAGVCLLNVTEFMPFLKTTLDDLSRSLFGVEACYGGGLSDSGMDWLCNLFSTVIQLFDEGSLDEWVIFVFTFLSSTMTIINVIIDCIELVRGRTQYPDGSFDKNTKSSVGALIRYILNILFLSGFIAVCGLFEGNDIGLYTCLLIIIMVLLLVLTIIRMIVASAKEKKFYAKHYNSVEEETTEDEEEKTEEEPVTDTENVTETDNTENTEPVEEVAAEPVAEEQQQDSEKQQTLPGFEDVAVVETASQEEEDTEAQEEQAAPSDEEQLQIPIEEVPAEAEAPAEAEEPEEKTSSIFDESESEPTPTPTPAPTPAPAPAPEQVATTEQQPVTAYNPYAQQPANAYNPYMQQPIYPYAQPGYPMYGQPAGAYNPYVQQPVYPYGQPAGYPMYGQPVAPAAAAPQQPVAENKPTEQDTFLTSLSAAEREEFTEVFIDRSKGKIGNIPEYKEGGDNSDFFPSVFVHINRIRNICSDELLAKIYKQIGRN